MSGMAISCDGAHEACHPRPPRYLFVVALHYTPYVFSQAHCELASNVHGLSWSRRVCSFPEPATLSDNSSARLPSSINQPRRIVQSNSQYLSISRHRKFLLQIPEGLGGFATSLGGSSDSYDNRYYRGSKGGTTTRP